MTLGRRTNTINILRRPGFNCNDPIHAIMMLALDACIHARPARLPFVHTSSYLSQNSRIRVQQRFLWIGKVYSAIYIFRLQPVMLLLIRGRGEGSAHLNETKHETMYSNSISKNDKIAAK